MNSASNLKLRTDAEVRRITFGPKGKARGVILENDRSEIFLNAGGKLVLTAGTLQTARLLQISGALFCTIFLITKGLTLLMHVMKDKG